MSATRIRRLADHDLTAHRGSLLRWAITELKLREAGVPVGLRTNVGLDIASAGVLGFNQGGAGVAIGGYYSGTTATAPAAGTFTTDAVNLPANSVVGQMIVITSGATRFGIVQSNTSATNSVLTIDRWYDATALPPTPAPPPPPLRPRARGSWSAATPPAPTWRWRTRAPRPLRTSRTRPSPARSPRRAAG
jgi:hypothetical protein